MQCDMLCKERIKAFRFFFLLTVLLLSATLCKAQSLSLSMENVPLSAVFRAIQQQSPYRFIYTTEDLATAKKVSINVQKGSIVQVLEHCFQSQPLDYTLEDQYIVVRSKPLSQAIEPAAGGITLSGIVTNREGVPIPGVTVIIKGTGKATVTDNEGRFRLAGAGRNGVARFTSVGFLPYEAKVPGDQPMLVQLQQNISSLDETIIIAYGTATKRLNTGSIGKVSGGEISNQPVANVLSALQGRVAGVLVTTESGIPGAHPKIQIRGRNSIAAGNNPLFIVDGVPFPGSPLNQNLGNYTPAGAATSPLNSINPDDIESVEILKDADATAIYGSRGANGVVLITTKKAQADKTAFSLNISKGYSRVTRYMDLLSLPQYLQLRREAFLHDGIIPDESTAPDLLAWDTAAATDWQKEILGNTNPTTDMQASLSGGRNGTMFLLSANYHKEGTVLPGDQHYNRGGAFLNLQHTAANKRFGATVTTSFTADGSRLVKPDVSGLVTLAPHFPLYTADSQYNWVGGQNLNALLRQRSKTDTRNFLTNTILWYQLGQSLTLKANAGYSLMTMSQVITLPQVSQDPGAFPTPSNTTFFGDFLTGSFILEPQLVFTRKKDDYSLEALAGMSYQQATSRQQLIQGDNFANEQLMESLAAAGSITNRTNSRTEYKYASLFGRINYSLRGKYVLNGTIRRDGSSRFGLGQQFGIFGAAGAAWIFSEASFFKDSKLPFSFGKLRASYGTTGNDQIGDYGYLSTYNTGSFYGGNPALVPARIANPLYTWETTRKLEGAVELGLFNNRVLLTTAYFRNRSGNQLIAYPLPSQSGFSSYQANLPALVQNKGIEIELTTTNMQQKQFRWTSNFNLSLLRNKLVSFPNLAATAYAYTYVIGEPLDIAQGYELLQIDPLTGLPQFEDRDKDGAISFPLDYGVIANLNPSFFGGLGNSLSYRNFQIDVFFQSVRQKGIGISLIPGLDAGNLPAAAFDRWNLPGQQTAVMKPTTTPGTPGYDAAVLYTMSSGTIENRSFTRLKNLSVSYSLPTERLARWKVQAVRLYLQGQNLLTFSSYKTGLDPETGIGGIPPLRTLVAGMQFSL